MKIFARPRALYRQWRWKQVSKNSKAELREFVYLDEVSVYSLIASRLGPIASEITDNQATLLEGEFNGSIGAGLGLANAEVSSRALSSYSQGSQVLRKSTVQTTFKELYELEFDSLTMKPVTADLEVPKFRDLDDIEDKVDGIWIVDPEQLTRGNLLEMEVELEAEATFRVSTVVSSLVEIIKEDPDLFKIDNWHEVFQIGRILEKFLFGLIPVSGQSVDYRVIEIKEKEWVVHRKLLDQLTGSNSYQIFPLYIVGVVEKSLFWKDIRRVLFSKTHYRILYRVGLNGLRKSWSPVKLADVLQKIAPELAYQINNLGTDALATMIETSISDRITQPVEQLRYKALVEYAELLIKHYKVEISSENSLEVQQIARQNSASFGSLEERRASFDAIAKFVLELFEIEQEPVLLTEFRSMALGNVGLDISGQINPLKPIIDTDSPGSSDKRYLDSEFIAIYW